MRGARPRRRILAAGIAAALALLAGACGDAGGSSGPIVMAPSSFATVADEIDARADAPDVRWVIAGSSRLVAQLEAGADVATLITADRATMDDAAQRGLIRRELAVLATNRLVLALAPGNPGDIAAIDDLDRSGVALGVCAPQVPCGRLAAEAIDALELDASPATEETSVRALARKVEARELDAGFVYATDARALGLTTVDDGELAAFVTEYPAASVDGDDAPMVDFLRGTEGRALLESLGFGVP